MQQVECFFDFGAPLCFAAHERARRLAWDVAWVPWETHPEIPSPGRPRRADEATLPEEVERTLASEALPFKPSRLVPNTRVALRASLWADANDGGEDFRDGVFRRLYGRGLESHCSSVDILAGLIERAGMDPIAFLDDMKAGYGERELTANGARARSAGFTSSPTFVLAGVAYESLGPEVEARLRAKDHP